MIRWPAVRATLLALAILISLADCSPLPRSARRRDLDSVHAVDERRRMVAAMQSAGLNVDEAAWRSLAWSWARFGVAVREDVLGPLRPGLTLIGTGQSWALFSQPDRHPNRLVVEGRVGAEWRRLYAALDDEHSFLSAELGYRRLRAVYDNEADDPGKAWPRFGEWVAKKTFTAFPEIDAVRVSFVRMHTYEPGEKGVELREDEVGLTQVVER